VLIDVDGLKALNDACGHQAGDELLVAVGSLLSSSNVGAYRIGGDEFALIVDRKQGATVSASLQRLKPFELDFASCGHRHRVGLTYGYASLHENESFDHFFRRADARLVQCKRRLYAGGHREDRRSQDSGPGRTTQVDSAAREVLSLEAHRRSRTRVS
jgi:diguanylate cyclase (GGDEF)-like protein